MSFAVQATPEFYRVRDLPRRPQACPPELVELLTAALRTTTGTQTLFPIQAFALAEAHDNNGLFAPIPVGGGKTLISILAPTLMHASRPVRCALNMTTSQLLPQLQGDVDEARKHWRFDHGAFRAISYDMLSQAKNATFLDNLQPDLLILDEAHALADPTSARTKRFLRYMRANPDTRLIALSGTPMKKSLFDFWHLLKLALPHGCPLPLRWNEVTDWDSVLGNNTRPDAIHRSPGALLKLCAEGEDVRKGYSRRLLETPGIVGSSVAAVDSELIIRERPLALPAEIRGILQTLRRDYVTPWGEELENADALWRIVRQLASGFYYKWVWPTGKPDVEWLEARKQWHRDLRDILRKSWSGMDSPMLVANAVRLGKLDVRSYWPWAAVMGRYRPTPPREAVWLSNHAVDDAAAWLDANPKGICWYESTAFGERLASRHHIPNYGPGAKASKAIRTERRPICASIPAHGTGKNLQHYNASLLVFPPSSGKVMEQLLGRTHRPGQLSSRVAVDMYVPVEEIRDGLDRAKAQALAYQALYNSPQKICLTTH